MTLIDQIQAVIDQLRASEEVSDSELADKANLLSKLNQAVNGTGASIGGATSYLSRQNFVITTNAIVGVDPVLTIPNEAVSARVTVFSDSPLDLWVGRFYRDGTNPTNTQGIPVGNTDERQFNTIEGLSTWRFRKLDAISSVTVIVEYWGI